MEAEIRERTDAYIHARHHHPAWQLLIDRSASAALLEARAQDRGVTPSGYAAHALRAHLRGPADAV